MCSMNTFSLRTPRLQLRPLHADDAAALYAYRSDPQVVRFQGWNPQGEAEVADFIAGQAGLAFDQADSWYQLGLYGVDDDTLIGDVGVHFPASREEAVELGVTIRPSSQRQGYASEALGAVIGHVFGALGYRRIVGSVDPRNTSSCTLLRSLGFRQEAHHVESLYFRGEWVDDLVFALLDREWTSAGAMPRASRD